MATAQCHLQGLGNQVLSMDRLGVRLASLAEVVALVVGLLFRRPLAGGLTHSFLPSFSHPFGGLPLVRYDDGATKHVGSQHHSSASRSHQDQSAI